MFKLGLNSARQFSLSTLLRNVASTTIKESQSSSLSPSLNKDLAFLKFDSNASQRLYAVCKLYNVPYMVTKGDRLILPYKIKNHSVGDLLKLNNVVTLGSRNFTYSDKKGIPDSVYELTATVAEITKEPMYHIVKTKQRCRRTKTLEVQPFQTHLVINELRLK